MNLQANIRFQTSTQDDEYNDLIDGRRKEPRVVVFNMFSR